jgi:hypothetical protein
MSTSDDRFRELRKALDDQYTDDQLVVIGPDGAVRPVQSGSPGQSIVLRDPQGEYAPGWPAR